MVLFGLENELVVLISIILITISIVIIVFGVFFVLKRKSVEEKHADKILDSLRLLKEGKKLQSKEEVAKQVPVQSSKPSAPPLEIKKEENSLKQMLIKKFQPKVETQLGAKIEVLDFNAKENNFLLLAIISGVKILLTLDASGKIIDYKKIKQ